LIGVGLVSVFLGLVQVAQGQGSELRFFEITNPTEAVGFFANRNHFAALIYCVILFAVAWTIPAATDVGTKLSQWQFDVASILKALAAFTVLVMLLAGETMARSRAGLALTMVALFGALVLGLAYQSGLSFRTSNLRERFRWERLLAVSPTKLLAIAVAVTVIFSLQYALFRIQERFEADPVDDARLVFIPNTIEAAKAYLPFGSGLGTFVSVYPLFEKAEGTLANTYANHAHNDAVEAALETGIFGLVLMGLFVTWLAYRSAAVWTGPIARGASELDQTLARAATIVIGLLLAHSLVDYPLRTGAMMAVMAFACALLIPPSTAEEPSTAHAREDAHFPVASEFPAPRLPSTRGKPAKAQDVPATGKRRWGSDINWPKEWSNQTKLPGEDEPPRK
jgi:O-antigen ligase